MTTTLGDTDVADLARRLYEAERTRVPIRQISLEHPEMTIEDSYAVQNEWRRRAQEAGFDIVHPLTDEPWGVTRFFYRDESGNVVNVGMHTP